MRAAPIALVAFILVAGFGGYLFLYASQLPKTNETTSTLMSYTQRATFTHTETVKPSSVENTTVLGNGQGPIFQSLTKDMDVSFAYSLVTDVPADGTLSVQYKVLLNARPWNVTLSSIQPSALAINGSTAVSSAQTFDLNVTNILAFISKIQPETGYYSTGYIIQVESLVAGRVSPQGSPSEFASVSFKPVLSATLENGLIVVNGTSYTSTGTISGTSAVPNNQPAFLRNLSFVIILGAVVGIAVSLVFTLRAQKPVSPEKELEAEASFYQEAISQVAGPPRTKSIVDVRTLGDLVKVSDTLGKPILRWRGAGEAAAEHHYYVLDGQTCYRFEIANIPPKSDEA